MIFSTLTNLISLHFFEYRQNIVIAPAIAPQSRPTIIIITITSNVDHAVNSAGPSKGFTTVNVHHSITEVFLRYSDKAVIIFFIAVQTKNARWNTHPRAFPITTGFNQAHPNMWVGAKSVSHHAAS